MNIFYPFANEYRYFDYVRLNFQLSKQNIKHQIESKVYQLGFIIMVLKQRVHILTKEHAGQTSNTSNMAWNSWFTQEDRNFCLTSNQAGTIFMWFFVITQCTIRVICQDTFLDGK